MIEHCPECGATWQEGATCQDLFHQMLFWENEHPGHGEVHHLMVLCYHLQHPGLLSPEWLVWGKKMLIDFIERGISPEIVRIRGKGTLNSNRRAWKIKAAPDRRGSYENPVRWSKTVENIASAGPAEYVQSVRIWTNAILQDLKASGNLQGNHT